MNLPIFRKRTVRGGELTGQYLVRGIEDIGVETIGLLSVEFSDRSWQHDVPARSFLSTRQIKEAAQLVGLVIEDRSQVEKPAKRHRRTRRVCKHGHPLTLENRIPRKDGRGVRCRACYLAYNSRRKLERAVGLFS